MKTVVFFSFGAALAVTAADLPPRGLLEPAFGLRVGLDTNPLGTSGTSATLLGDRETLAYAASASVGYGWSSATAAKPGLKLTYAGETVRFDRWSGEDFSTHRLAASAQLTPGDWKLTAEGSSLFVDGSRATLASIPSVNANATALWRERRHQWQHRLKLQAQASYGDLVMRSTGTLLAYDYRTTVVAGKVAFADRSDALAGLDLGWKQSAQSLWFAGLRTGHQTQAVIPLPNCGFDYTNNYQRLALGWEGRLPANTSVSLMAGPDFRHYSGAIDPGIFLGGRDRASLWLEGGFTAKPTPTWIVTGKAARFSWLSSTGKSAYYDSSAELAAAWVPSQAWSARFSAKVHRCDYFPAVRDDWESMIGAGVTRKISPRVQVSAELVRHHAWNTLASATEREFHRFVVNLATNVRL